MPSRCASLAPMATSVALPLRAAEPASTPYVDIERRLTPEQRHATGLDTLSPEQLALLNRLLDWLTGLCDQCEGAPRHWNIRLHPYRIVAEAGASGNPTPEGLHRDGVDYIVSMLVSRSNVEGGETTITNNDREVLWQRTLQRPLDIMVGLDAQTLHSVTPVTPLDPQRPAWRDVLVVAFTKVQP